MEFTTRKSAIAAGSGKYFTGKPCVHGHIADRYTQSGACSECLGANRHFVAAALADAGIDLAAAVAAKRQERRRVLESLIGLKVRCYPADWPRFLKISAALLRIRYPVLTDGDAWDHKAGKDASSGTLLYVVNAHPDDRDALKGEERRLLNARAPDMAAVRDRIYGAVQTLVDAQVETPPPFKP